ncbi:MAG: RNA-guided endonuclease InsQ/TnpB family protein, partial [Nostoc sp.]
AEVMLCWAKGTLPGVGTSLVDADASSSTTSTSKRKQAGSMRELGQKKRQKSVEGNANNELGDVETHSSGEANCG